MQDDVIEIADVEVLEISPEGLRVVIDGTDVWVPYEEIAADSELGADARVGDVGLLTVSIIWASEVLYNEYDLEDDDASS